MMEKEILDSWKAISDYLDRDIRTCARWEKELGLPIYRINNHSPRSKVFAYKAEIEEWLHDRANHKEIKEIPFIQKKWVILGLLASVVLLLAVSVSLYIGNGKFSSNNLKNLAIAVLPFESSNFSENELYIAGGINDRINNNLLKLDNIVTIPQALFSKEDSPSEKIKIIRENFKASHTLKTKIEKKEKEIMISVQFIRIDDYKIIWDIKSAKPLKDYFSLPEDICLKIYNKFNLSKNKIVPLTNGNGTSQDYEAVDLFLQGNHFLNGVNPENNDPRSSYNKGKYYEEQWTKESTDRAISCFNQAIERDENFALAYIGLARCFVNYVNFNWDDNEEWLDKAEELLQKAEAISPESGDYYATLIQVYLLRYISFDADTKDDAINLAQDALKKFPSNAQLYAQLGYCHYLQFAEFGDEADFKKALENNLHSLLHRPSHVGNIAFTEFLMLNKDFELALAVCERIQNGEASLMADFRKGETYYYMGALDASEALFLQLENKGDLYLQIGSLFHQAMIAAQRKDTDKTMRIIKKLNTLVPEEFKYFADKLKLASIYMGIGEKELGYRYLEDFFNDEKTKKTRFIYHKYVNIDKNFDAFRGEERFKNIIQ